MISEKLQNAINEQISAEMWSSNLYLSMSFYFEREGFSGFAHWMKKQSQEEMEMCIRDSFSTLHSRYCIGWGRTNGALP